MDDCHLHILHQLRLLLVDASSYLVSCALTKVQKIKIIISAFIADKRKWENTFH